MAKPRKSQDMEETKRIMERLVNTPPKPHDDSKRGKAQTKKDAKPKKKNG